MTTLCTSWCHSLAAVAVVCVLSVDGHESDADEPSPGLEVAQRDGERREPDPFERRQAAERRERENAERREHGERREREGAEDRKLTDAEKYRRLIKVVAQIVESHTEAREIRSRLKELGDGSPEESRELRQHLEKVNQIIQKLTGGGGRREKTDSRDREHAEKREHGERREQAEAEKNRRGRIEELHQEVREVQARLKKLGDRAPGKSRMLQERLRTLRREIQGLAEGNRRRERDGAAEAHRRVPLAEIEREAKRIHRRLKEVGDRARDESHNLKRALKQLHERVQHLQRGGDRRPDRSNRDLDVERVKRRIVELWETGRKEQAMALKRRLGEALKQRKDRRQHGHQRDRQRDEHRGERDHAAQHRDLQHAVSGLHEQLQQILREMQEIRQQLDRLSGERNGDPQRDVDRRRNFVDLQRFIERKSDGSMILKVADTKVTAEHFRQLSSPIFKKVVAIEGNGTQLNDAALVHLKGLPLSKLQLHSTKITDAGLVHLKEMPLKTLSLAFTQVTDAGLSQLKQLPIESLMLAKTRVTDAGLAHLSHMPLRSLNLVWVNGITDAGLAHLANLPLEDLSFTSRKITDEGLKFLRNMPLRSLNLGETQVSDAGIAHLVDLPLKSVWLYDTKVTDASLVHLQKIKTLKMVFIQRTRFSEEAAAKLRKTVRLVHTGRTKKKPTHFARITMDVRISHVDISLAKAKEFKEPFAVNNQMIQRLIRAQAQAKCIKMGYDPNRISLPNFYNDTKKFKKDAQGYSGKMTFDFYKRG